MKKLYILIPVIVLILSSCTKRDYISTPVTPGEWIRTHDHGVVAYVDYSTGNYIVETHNGFSVVQPWEDISPIENDHEYAYFSNRGLQTIYNQDGDYFTKGRVVDSWLTWNEALYLLDDLKYNNY